MRIFQIQYVTIGALGALAAPLQERASESQLCPPFVYSVPQCCEIVEQGIVGLGCQTPNGTLEDLGDFVSLCSYQHAPTPACCLLPIVSSMSWSNS